MTSSANCSPSCSSSSSFCSSSRYSRTSISSIRVEGSSPEDPLFQPFLDQGSLFREERVSDHLRGSCPLYKDDQESSPEYHSDSSSFQAYKGDLDSFETHGGDREGFGSYQGDRKSCSGSYQGDWNHGDSIQASPGRPASMGVVRTTCDSYYLSTDVGHFEPHDIVVMAYNHSIVIHAEKIGDNGCVRDKFSHKSVLPEDMDPLSVSGTLTPEGMLVISVRRTC